MDLYLILQLGLALAATLVAIWLRRSKSRFNRRVAYRQLAPSAVAKLAADYVVIGGGPAGLAASRTLLESSPDCVVVLVEAGADPLPSSAAGAALQRHKVSRHLLFQPLQLSIPSGVCLTSVRGYQAVKGERDWSAMARRPLREAGASAKEELQMLSYSAYPQGRMLGGTAGLSWQLELPSVFRIAAGRDVEERTWASMPARLQSSALHPLTWAFTKALCTLGLKDVTPAPSPKARRRCEAQDEDARSAFLEVQKGPGAVWRPHLNMDEDWCALPVSSVLLDGMTVGALARLHVLTGYQVTDFEMDDGAADRCVKGITCQRTCVGPRSSKEGSEVCLAVLRGVVVTAGMRGSPLLLRQMATRLSSSLSDAVFECANCRDAMAVPLLYKAHKGVTVDEHLQSSHILSFLRSLILGASPLAFTPFTEVVSCVPVKECGPRAKLFIFMLPFGGRNDCLLFKLGIDRLLGTYQHAAVFLLVLTGVDGLSHRIDMTTRESETAAGDPAKLKRRFERVHAFPFSVSAAPTVGLQIKANVQKAFIKGIRLCRDAARTPPLSLLLQGDGEQEALDYSLLHKEPSKAVRLAQLMHIPSRKLTAKMKQEVVELVKWGREISVEEGYLREYVCNHCRWLGFGSGSSEGFLEEAAKGKRNFFVKGIKNVVVGDCSAVREEDWVRSGRNALVAGSASTAIDAGCAAAQQLASTVRRDVLEDRSDTA